MIDACFPKQLGNVWSILLGKITCMITYVLDIDLGIPASSSHSFTTFSSQDIPCGCNKSIHILKRKGENVPNLLAQIHNKAFFEENKIRNLFEEKGLECSLGKSKIYMVSQLISNQDDKNRGMQIENQCWVMGACVIISINLANKS